MKFKTTTMIFMGDIWKPRAQWDSRYLWKPLAMGVRPFVELGFNPIDRPRLADGSPACGTITSNNAVRRGAGSQRNCTRPPWRETRKLSAPPQPASFFWKERWNGAPPPHSTAIVLI